MKHIKKLLTLVFAAITLMHLIACDQYRSPPPPNSITLIAVGDIMLGGTAEEILLKKGYDYPFRKVQHLLRDSDIVIGNLEGPLTNADETTLDKEYLFKSPPDSVAPALKKAGFNIMNLANNHILDFGIEGMNDTIDSLQTQHIKTVGVGNNASDARSGTIITTSSGTIGFLSYSLTFPKSFWASNEKPGTAFGHKKDIKEDVKRLSEQVDYVIVSFHWGREKSFELRPYQPTLAHAAIDAGADIVLGHHPHVLQGIENYNNGLIIYSLGNFVFGSYSTTADTSVVARLTLYEGKFYSAEFTPINVLNTEVIFQPHPLKGKAATNVIKHINSLSKALNTNLIQTNDKGFLHTRSN